MTAVPAKVVAVVVVSVVQRTVKMMSLGAKGKTVLGNINKRHYVNVIVTKVVFHHIYIVAVVDIMVPRIHLVVTQGDVQAVRKMGTANPGKIIQ